MSRDTKDFAHIAGASSNIGAIYADCLANRGHADNKLKLNPDLMESRAVT